MELSVPYNIAFYKAGEKLGSSPWNGTLDKAKQHAADYLCIMGADHVVVTDDDTGAEVYSKKSSDAQGS